MTMRSIFIASLVVANGCSGTVIETDTGGAGGATVSATSAVAVSSSATTSSGMQDDNCWGCKAVAQSYFLNPLPEAEACPGAYEAAAAMFDCVCTHCDAFCGFCIGNNTSECKNCVIMHCDEVSKPCVSDERELEPAQ